MELIRTIFKKIIEPSKNVQKEETKSQSRLISSLIISYIVIGFISLIVYQIIIYENYFNFIIHLSGIPVMLFAFFLAKNGFYQSATIITIVLSSLLTLFGGYSDINFFTFLVPPIIIASIFLNVKKVIGLVGLQIIAMNCLMIFKGEFNIFELWGGIIPFIIINTVFIIISKIQNRQLEEKRQKTLTLKNEDLEKEVTAHKKTARELQNTIEHLTKLNKLTVDRELRLIELKKQVQELQK